MRTDLDLEKELRHWHSYHSSLLQGVLDKIPNDLEDIDKHHSKLWILKESMKDALRESKIERQRGALEAIEDIMRQFGFVVRPEEEGGQINELEHR